jgi:hypothetical protein
MSVMAFAVQFSSGHHPKGGSLLGPALTLAVSAIVGWSVLTVLRRVVPPSRQWLNLRRARRRWLHAAAMGELRARAMMDELCPHGWQAEITLYSSAEELPEDAPDPEHTRVHLDWEALHEPTVSRRLWGESVNQALEAMVADRVTEDTLHQIEQQALADGISWPDFEP